VKNRKWLLILIGAIVILNVAIFVALRLTKVDHMVKERLTRFLREQAGLEVAIGDFDFNDKQVNVSNISITSLDGTFSGVIRQIYVEYDLFTLVAHRFKDFSSISMIHIYNPSFSVDYTPKPGPRENGGGQLPDLEKYFKQARIHDGAVAVKVHTAAGSVEMGLQGIMLNLYNEEVSRISLQAYQDTTGLLSCEATLSKEGLNRVAWNVKHLVPDLQLLQQHSLDFSLFSEGVFTADSLRYDLFLQDIALSYGGEKARIDTVHASGSNQAVAIKATNARINGYPITLGGVVSEPFGQAHLQAELQVPYWMPGERVPDLQGAVSLDATLDCPLNKLAATVKLHSDSLRYGDHTLRAIAAELEATPEKVILQSLTALWRDNALTLSGSYLMGDELNLKLHPTTLAYMAGNLELQGTLQAQMRYADKLSFAAKLSDFHSRFGPVGVDAINGDISFADDVYHINISQKTNLAAQLHGNLAKGIYDAEFDFSRFRLNTYDARLKLPMASGSLKANYSPDSVFFTGDVHIYDQHYGKYDGVLTTRVIANRKSNKSAVSLALHDGRFNYAPISMYLEADGTMDSLATKRFTINDKIDLNGWCRLTPDFGYGLSMETTRLRIRDILRYTVPSYVAENIAGTISCNLHYNRHDDNQVTGFVQVDDAGTQDISPLSATMDVSGTRDSIRVGNIAITNRQQTVLTAEAAVITAPSFGVELQGWAQDVALQNLLPESDIRGLVNATVNYNTASGRTLDLDARVMNFSAGSIMADSINCAFTQRDSLLRLHRAEALFASGLNVRAEGALGYNLLTSDVFADSHQVAIQIDGDLLGLVDMAAGDITEAYSKGNISLAIGTDDEGLTVPAGSLVITRGKLHLKDQQEAFEKIRLSAEIVDNKLTIHHFSTQMGDAGISLRNEIQDDEKDFVLGPLIIGHMYLKSDENGVLFHMPGYMPNNSVGNVVIQGRNSDEFEITGPFDNIMITGDLLISNGDAIYPPKTENLFKIFSMVRTEKKSETPAEMPFTLDLMLHFGDNVRYVTYPVTIDLRAGSYVHLMYSDGEWQVPEALFTATSGSADMFGTVLTLDFAEVVISKHLAESQQGIKINGTFYKDVPDGTRISMDVYTDRGRTGYSIGNLGFTLRSDKGNENITDILYLLRYGRRPMDISDDERNALLQDDVVQIAGLGINSAILDPLISPVENNLRRWLRLDVVQLRTEIIQNIFAAYTGETTQEGFTMETNRNSTTKFSADTFLNNLSIRTGKFITRKLFWDYEVRFQKPADFTLNPEIGVYHDVSLRYALPWQLSLRYSLKIDPEKKEDYIQEVSLERSFKFW
jgi:hypothetical protein